MSPRTLQPAPPRRRLVTWIGGLALVLLLAPAPAAANAAAGRVPESPPGRAFDAPTVAATAERCFTETAQCLAGDFLAFWEENGGLAVFGYPITPARQEVNRDSGRPHLTQWLERARFELHPENRPPYTVLLGRLGDDGLRRRGVDWRALPGDEGPRAGCLWFQATRLNLCDEEPGLGFLTHWRTHGLQDPALDTYGRSLALFGNPLTRPRPETNAAGDTVVTQHFERARFEWHPQKPFRYRVLLGLLGNEVAAVPVRPLAYLWPTTLPPSLVVRPAESFARDSIFVLQLDDRAGGQFSATVTGGPESNAASRPPAMGSRPVTVRGQPGVAFTTGAGYSLWWTEGGQPYAVVSGLGLEAVLRLAEGLEALDLESWRRRLAAS